MGSRRTQKVNTLKNIYLSRSKAEKKDIVLFNTNVTTVLNYGCSFLPYHNDKFCNYRWIETGAGKRPDVPTVVNIKIVYWFAFGLQ